jgi:hypothetical protein
MPLEMTTECNKLWTMFNTLRADNKSIGSIHMCVLKFLVPGDIFWCHLQKNKDGLFIAVQDGSENAILKKKAYRSDVLVPLNQVQRAMGFYVPQVIAGHEQGRLYFRMPMDFGVMMSGHHNTWIYEKVHMPCTLHFPTIANVFWIYDDRSSYLLKIGIMVIWEMQGKTAVEVYKHKMNQWKQARGNVPIYETLIAPDKLYKVRPTRFQIFCEWGGHGDVRKCVDSNYVVHVAGNPRVLEVPTNTIHAYYNWRPIIIALYVLQVTRQAFGGSQE